MDKFYIITNKIKDPGFQTTQMVRDYLQKQGKTCLFQEHSQQELDLRDYKYTDASLIPEDVDCVLAIGGDGTLLQAVRDLVEREIPLLGINQGTLGYLAEVDKSGIQPALDHLIADSYMLEERMMLCGTAFHQGKRLMRDLALNDIVIGRNGRLRIIDMNIYVNGAFLNSYCADGMIVSSPTGSTGYSLSAGGPIVSPEASLLLLTPIAPHTLNARSIVLPDDARITIEIAQGRPSSVEGAEATFDGDTSVKLSCGDKIEICKADQKARLVKINNISFLETLRKKMSG